MNKRIGSLLFILLFGHLLALVPLQAQPATPVYWVFFKDKPVEAYDPYQWLDPLAIERRQRNNFPIDHISDYPVSKGYLEQVAALADSLGVISRWFNAVAVHAGMQAIEAIGQLEFVDSVMRCQAHLLPAQNVFADNILPRGQQLSLLYRQTEHLGGERFRKADITGKGIRIAILDAGFTGAHNHPALKHVYEEDRLIDSWDFFAKRESVYRSNEHGTQVWSAIAGMMDSIPMGLAYDAEFLLARTETRTEPRIEEQYWLAALEWAERRGAHIVNSSLGYTYQRYFPENMDGNTSLIARSAALAFEKGLLVISAAGNEGQNKDWRVIATPGDAEHILTVGALDPANLLRANYSSVGPTQDGRLKPEVSAMGNIVAARGNGGYNTPQGTSFASPLIAGFAACVMQMHPEYTAREVYQAIIESATLYPYYDYAHGYGIPQAEYFFQTKTPSPTLEILHNQNQLSVKILSPKRNRERYFYYHIQNAQGRISRYYVIEVNRPEVLKLQLNGLEPGSRVVFHYMGYTESFVVKHPATKT